MTLIAQLFLLLLALYCYTRAFQDFLIKLDMKPHTRLVDISVFSLNNVTVRPTKIMSNLLKHLKIQIFKVIFQFGKLIEFHNFGRSDDDII